MDNALFCFAGKTKGEKKPVFLRLIEYRKKILQSSLLVITLLHGVCMLIFVERMKNLFFFAFVVFFSTGLGAQVFSSAKIINTMVDPEIVKTADFNHDGYDDIVFATIFSKKIVVRLFDPGTGDFGEEILLASDISFVLSLFPADIDGDGYIDVCGVSMTGNKVYWFKNTGGSSFSDILDIDNEANGASSVIAVDLDGDGDTDVAVTTKNNHQVQWYENTGSGNAFVQHIITAVNELPAVLTNADIDNDGDEDLIVGFLLTHKIVCFENDGSGNFTQGEILTTAVNNLSSLFAADLNNDRYVDIISASRNDNKVAWYANENGSGSFSSEIIISDQMSFAFEAVACDFDMDNDMDVLCSAAGGDEILLFTNPGSGNFEAPQIISNTATAPKGLTTGDYDGDGDPDIVAALSGQNPDVVVWYENGESNFVLHKINQNRSVVCTDVYDVDGDGDDDVFYSDGNNVCWVENIDNGASFGTENFLYSQGFNIFEIRFEDVDNDNDKDLFIVDALGDQLLMKKNNNGSFGTTVVIDGQGDGPFDIDFSDVDGDGDIDLLVGYLNDNHLVIFENTTGQGSFTKHIITDDNLFSVCFSDIDNDGNEDVVYVSYDKVFGMLNDGNGNFQSPFVLNNQQGYADGVMSLDLNNDTYSDLIYTPDYQLGWMKNLQNNTYQNEAIDFYGSSSDFAVADVDNDGGTDIFVACRLVGRMYYVLNEDNANELITMPYLPVEDAYSIEAANINNDGYGDCIIGTWPSENLYWAENYQFRLVRSPFDRTACIGDQTFFSVLSTGAVQYQWQMDSGNGFVNMEDNDTFSGSHKAKLMINTVSSSLDGNMFRCVLHSRNEQELITENAVLTIASPEIFCQEDQVRDADTSNTYTVAGNEFDVDSVFFPCNQNYSLINDYNNASSLDGAVFDVGEHTIHWELKDENNQVLADCSFEVTIQEYVGIPAKTLSGDFAFFPNPVRDVLYFRNSGEIRKIKLTNMEGKTFWKWENTSGKQAEKIDLSRLGKGVYLIYIENDNRILVRKIVKI